MPIIEYKLQSGEMILIESPEPSGPAMRSVASHTLAAATTTLEEAIDSVRPGIEAVVKVLREVAPDELEVKFGIKLKGELGILASAGAEAQFEVTLSWKAAGARESK